MTRRVTTATSRAALVGLCAGLTSPALAQAQAPAAQASPATTAFVRNWTRAEVWSFFEPRPGGGDPDYADIANRLQVGVRRTARRYDLVAAFQYVQFGGLPRGATGPGPLGVGALYFEHSGRSDSRQLYLRYLNVKLKALAGGLDVQVGRMSYTSGAESASGVPKIEAVKRQRIDSRLIGEFEWSIYQRGFDGVRLDWTRPTWHVSGAALRPTQGGFEEAAGVGIDDIDLVAATATFRPGRPPLRTETQIFAYRYDDRREVQGRPDNTGRPAARADLGVTTLGVTLVAAYPRGAREIDAVVWLAGQTGSWYEQSHRAYALAVEAGHHWTKAPWQPWVRAGVGLASGDDDPADDRHATFFQMLPTARKYSLSATYALMNLTDVFVQALLRPRPALSLRIDLHRVGLATAADRWYAGSGATQQRGATFGYAGRPSNGATRLGTVLEGSADYTVTRRWSINGYAGLIRGGDVVRRLFAGDRLVFAYLENVLQF